MVIGGYSHISNLDFGVYCEYYGMVLLFEKGDVENVVRDKKKSLSENFPYRKWHAYPFEMSIFPGKSRKLYTYIIVEPLSMMIDPKGTFCMWKDPFIDRDLIIRGIRLFSTGKPTYKPIKQQKDGGYNYRIDVEDGNFFVGQKNFRGEYDRRQLLNGVEGVKKLAGVYDDKSLLLYSADSEVSVGPKTALLKSDGEASSSSTPTKDALQSSGSDLEVFGQSHKFLLTNYQLDYNSTGTKDSWSLGFSELKLKSYKCAGCVLCSPLTSGDEQLQLLNQFHNAVFQVPGDLLEFLLNNKIIRDERSKSKKTRDRKNKRKPMLPDIEFLTPSNSTSLTKGSHSDRHTLKRQILKVNASDSDLKEVEIVRMCVGLPNILVSLIDEDEHFYNVVTEPYTYSLEDIISSPNHPLAGKMEDFLRDTTNGLLSLHRLGIIHGDLRPSNVKICESLSLGSFTAKVTDMTGCGRMPDDFADLGHLSFFALTKGKFLLHDTLKDDTAIKKAGSDLSDNYPEVHDLIFDVLLRERSRPTDVEVSNHPFLFGPDNCASFLERSSNFIEYENDHLLFDAILNLGDDVYGNNWGVTLNIEIFDTLGYYDDYSEKSMRRLLRAIRNGIVHLEQIDQNILAVLGKTPGEIGNYYRTKLPKLLIKVYRVMQKHCKNTSFREMYFKWCV